MGKMEENSAISRENMGKWWGKWWGILEFTQDLVRFMRTWSLFDEKLGCIWQSKWRCFAANKLWFDHQIVLNQWLIGFNHRMWLLGLVDWWPRTDWVHWWSRGYDKATRAGLHQAIDIFVLLFAYPSVCLFACLLVCLPACLAACQLPVCMSVDHSINYSSPK